MKPTHNTYPSVLYFLLMNSAHSCREHAVSKHIALKGRCFRCNYDLVDVYNALHYIYIFLNSVFTKGFDVESYFWWLFCLLPGGVYLMCLASWPQNTASLRSTGHRKKMRRKGSSELPGQPQYEEAWSGKCISLVQILFLNYTVDVGVHPWSYHWLWGSNSLKLHLRKLWGSTGEIR